MGDLTFKKLPLERPALLRLKISQNFKENTYIRVSFLIMLQKFKQF